MGEQWREIADRVYVRRHNSLDLNIGLIVGDGGCLVIDTRSHLGQARDLIAAIRQVTKDPWTVVNTHAHYDHYFGNQEFRPAAIWGTARAAEVIRDYGHVHLAWVVNAYRERDMHEHLAHTEPVVPDPPERTFDGEVALDIAGRPVVLRYLGRGHTDGDLIVDVTDTDVVFAGDLVEEGAPVGYSDAFPLDWPDTVAALTGLVRGPVVPGHGAVVDGAYVAAQLAEISRTADLAREAHAAGRTVEDTWAALSWLPEEEARLALARAYRQLDGQPAYDPPDVLLAAITAPPAG
jgi:glyoxylase-like metal-dependent hydrolase (beta-lactamase superfamily II)